MKRVGFWLATAILAAYVAALSAFYYGCEPQQTFQWEAALVALPVYAISYGTGAFLTGFLVDLVFARFVAGKATLLLRLGFAIVLLFIIVACNVATLSARVPEHCGL